MDRGGADLLGFPGFLIELAAADGIGIGIGDGRSFVHVDHVEVVVEDVLPAAACGGVYREVDPDPVADMELDGGRTVVLLAPVVRQEQQVDGVIAVEVAVRGKLIDVIADYIDRHNIDRYNQDAHIFTWTAKAKDILEKVRRARAVLNNVASA